MEIDYRLIFENSPSPFLLLTPDRRVVSVSEPYLKATGRRREDVMGRPVEEVFPDPGVRESVARALESRGTDRLPLLPTHEHRWRTTSTAIADAAGAVRWVLVRVEEVRDELDRFFSVSLDMLCISGDDGHFKKVNPAFQAVLGFTPEEMCAIPYLELIHPDDVEITKREVEKQLARGESVLSFENRYRHKDGSYRLLSWKSVPVGGQMYAVARDITEARRAEEQVKLANRELESFSYTVAHDLRTPLRAISGFSDILARDYGKQLDATGENLLRRISAAARKMGQLIDGLLELSRVARRELKRERVDLTEMALEVIREIRRSAPEREVDWSVAEGLVAEGDPRLLRVILVNLLGNAWKYTTRRREPVHIQFGREERDGSEAYFVRDNGAGFDMSHAANLFGAFQRMHADSEFEGLGIGLATVQRIVQRHGGRIWAAAEPDKGATFFFTL